VSVLRLGTRGSQLALWQANTVKRLLEDAGAAVEITIIKTSGDRLQEAPLSDAGGKRLFVKEIEDALLRSDIDLAVHSAKDMPALLPEGLTVAAALPREDPRDALVLPGDAPGGEADAVIAALGAAPTIATSSVRRSAQLATLIPGATFAAIRGNVDTRLRKLDAGGFAALVLATAGMKRLGFTARISASLEVTQCVPAPGQGIVAVEIRSDDDTTRAAVAVINDADAAISLVAERTVVAALGGGCQLPLGAVSLHQNGQLAMHAIVTSADGKRVVRRSIAGSRNDPASLGERLADALATGGAAEILDEVRRMQGPVEGSY
jgi:hydroxymethylbilane synthase